MVPISDFAGFLSVRKASRWLNCSTLSSKWSRSAMHFASLLILFIAAVFVFLYYFVMFSVNDLL